MTYPTLPEHASAGDPVGELFELPKARMHVYPDGHLGCSAWPMS